MVQNMGKLQWHPAFDAALHIELEEDLNILDIKNEYTLSKKPMRLDILIVKKEGSRKVKKTFGHIFRKHNIIEYKSPEDYLSINDFYKVYGYTCFYQSDTEKVCEIHPTELTITFVSYYYPRKMIEHLQKERNLEVRRYAQGIYHLEGDQIPIQVVVTKELSEQDYYWLQNLRTDLEGREEINELVRRYEERKSSRYYQAVMDLIVRANKEKMEEERYMCEALHELFAEDVEKAVEEVVGKVREEAKKEEAQRINTLNKLLAEQNRTADIIKAATEPEYQKKLMEELL